MVRKQKGRKQAEVPTVDMTTDEYMEWQSYFDFIEVNESPPSIASLRDFRELQGVGKYWFGDKPAEQYVRSLWEDDKADVELNKKELSAWDKLRVALWEKDNSKLSKDELVAEARLNVNESSNLYLEACDALRKAEREAGNSD